MKAMSIKSKCPILKTRDGPRKNGKARKCLPHREAVPREKEVGWQTSVQTSVSPAKSLLSQRN